MIIKPLSKVLLLMPLIISFALPVHAEETLWSNLTAKTEELYKQALAVVQIALSEPENIIYLVLGIVVFLGFLLAKYFKVSAKKKRRRELSDEATKIYHERGQISV